MESRPAYHQLLDDIRAAYAVAEVGTDAMVDRAAAMLAGRVGCRVGESRGHLIRIAGEQRRDVGEVATELMVMLESQAQPGGDRRARSVVDEVIGTAAPDEVRAPVVRDLAVEAIIQQALDALPGAYAWLTPVADAAGEVADFLVRAASPEAIDILGRRGAGMVGLSVRQTYPGAVDGPLWAAYLDIIAGGPPRQVDPLDYREVVGEAPVLGTYAVRVHPLGGGLLVGWTRQDKDEGGAAERIAQTERLASLGWGEWDLLTGHVTWSDEMYRIYEREPSLGPLSLEESSAFILPEDQHVRVESAESFAKGETVDITYRIRIGGRVKHLRAVIDAVRDARGQPLRLYGVVQDVSSREAARARLAEVERELRRHQQTLAAEHRLAAHLQQIVLPIPAGPIDLPGLRVVLRYLPAERASRVGGDWYHAATGTDGRVLLAVGDVAGHGLQAATTMAQLRHALAALAITTTTDPAELLSHLNRLLCASEAAAGTATAVIARYDPASGSVTWAQAGHPPPLRARNGATTRLPRPRGPLLGAAPDVRYANATVDLDPDDLLLLYTDGLVEDRQRSLEDGLRPVIEALNQISANMPPAPLAELLDRLHRANPDDDTCVLAARPLGRGGPGQGGPGQGGFGQGGFGRGGEAGHG